jgi:hypothetical protein
MSGRALLGVFFDKGEVVNLWRGWFAGLMSINTTAVILRGMMVRKRRQGPKSGRVQVASPLLLPLVIPM